MFRRVVFQKDRAGVLEIATRATAQIRDLAAADGATEWGFEYSPRPSARPSSTSQGDLRRRDRDLGGHPGAQGHREPAGDHRTVDTQHLRRPDRMDAPEPGPARSIVLSVHPHNDRGTAVAAAELAVMAGADRVEGCLFGSGERTGNVDLVTLALNLYAQGSTRGWTSRTSTPSARSPNIARSSQFTRATLTRAIWSTRRFGVPPGRHKEGLRRAGCRPQEAAWDMPYLPIDPADVGRTYDGVIRVNGQSGKGGIAYLIGAAYGLDLPRRLQIEFARVVQERADTAGGELTADLFALLEALTCAVAGGRRSCGARGRSRGRGVRRGGCAGEGRHRQRAAGSRRRRGPRRRPGGALRRRAGAVRAGPRRRRDAALRAAAVSALDRAE